MCPKDADRMTKRLDSDSTLFAQTFLRRTDKKGIL